MPYTRDFNLAMTAQQPPVATVAAPPSSAGAGHEEHLVSALHAAFHSLSSEHSIAPNAPTASVCDAVKGPHTSLDIAVANDQLSLRGTGVDVEPTLLTGNVVLNLSEPTSIKQILLVFRGKARVPSNPNDPHVLNTSPNQYIVCSHEWMFLEGEKKYSHTLKAGRHLFPFELRLGGSLPSSIATYVNGGASISYKLRATAVRPGLAANLTAMLPITLLRTFAPESLEYQQTLEIENTWPEKVMYAIMIPHKAWAAGDELVALVKFAPLAKGVRVLTITTNLCETTKTLARGGHLEKTRNVVTRKHEFVNGRAVSVEEQRKRLHNALQNTLGEYGFQQQHMGTTFSPGAVYSGSSSPGFSAGGASAFVSGTSTPVIEGISLTLSRPRSHGSSAESPSSSSVEERIEQDEGSNSEMSTSISVPLPTTLTPSHSLDPIIVSYRVRWSVLLGNLDGHTSELRCSLPIHILDHSLLEEARTATRATRRLLFGGEDAPRGAEEEDAQLPSYPSHVRDRVAVDVSLPEARALHPYAQDGLDSGATTPAIEATLGDFPGLSPVSASTLPSSYSPHDSGAFPFAYGPGAQPPHSVSASAGATPPESTSSESSRPNSRPNSRHGREASSGWGFSLSRRSSRSRMNSRANSRAQSPERDGGAHGYVGGTSSPSVSRADETHVHAANAASRQSHGLFNVVMKPLTSLSSFSAPWHANSHSQALAHHFQHSHRTSGSGDLRSMTMPLQTPATSHGVSLTHADGTLSTSASTSAVPDYFTAARTGTGVPPLETLRDLPTYEDSEAQTHRQLSPLVLPLVGSNGGEGHRSFSDTDLVSHFARARAGSVDAQSRRVR